MVAPNYALKRQELAKKIGPGAQAAGGRAGTRARRGRQEAAGKEGGGLRAKGAAAPWPPTREWHRPIAAMTFPRAFADPGRSSEPLELARASAS